MVPSSRPLAPEGAALPAPSASLRSLGSGAWASGAFLRPPAPSPGAAAALAVGLFRLRWCCLPAPGAAAPSALARRPRNARAVLPVVRASAGVALCCWFCARGRAARSAAFVSPPRAAPGGCSASPVGWVRPARGGAGRAPARASGGACLLPAPPGPSAPAARAGCPVCSCAASWGLSVAGAASVTLRAGTRGVPALLRGCVPVPRLPHYTPKNALVKGLRCAPIAPAGATSP